MSGHPSAFSSQTTLTTTTQAQQREAKQQGIEGRKRPSIQGLEFMGCSVGQSSLMPCASCALQPCTGWLGAWLGLCCGSSSGPPLLPEAGGSRVQTPASTANTSRVQTQDWGAEEEEYLASIRRTRATEAAMDLHPKQATECYLVENSLLQVQGHPGVGYRCTKREADRVPQDQQSPALWGEIVQGVEEEDGWLKVGKYYLPATYKGMSVLTPIRNSDVLLTASRRAACPPEQRKECERPRRPSAHRLPARVRGGISKEEDDAKEGGSGTEFQNFFADVVRKPAGLHRSKCFTGLSTEGEIEEHSPTTTCAPDSPQHSTPMSVASVMSPVFLRS